MNYLTKFLSKSYDEVTYKEFYRDIFPKGSFQKKRISEDDYGEGQQGKFNGIIVEVFNERYDTGKLKVHRYTLTDDLEKLDEVVGRDNFCLMSPISYAGKTRDSKNARELYALAFDLDGIQTRMKDGEEWPYGLANLLHQIDNMEIMPRPTYIVSSGTGLHLYYVLEEPLMLYQNVMEQLEVLKKELTRMMWHDSISKLVDEIQYEPVCQGFRIVGSITKNGERARAFKVGSKVTIEYLNQFVRDDYKMHEFKYKSKLTLQEAREKYPEWYQERIVENQPRGTWIFKRDVYDTWLGRIGGEANLGHRYWSLWVLAVTAMKCGIKYEELERDAFGLMDRMNEIDVHKKDPFTEDDILAALEGYDSAWFTYPIDKMAYRSDMPLVRNKRNGRKQKQHLKIARFTRDLNYEDENGWINKEGAPTKKEVVQNWQEENPKGTKADCIRETGLSKPTVYKWWL